MSLVALGIFFGVVLLLLLLSLRALAATGVPVLHMSPEVVETALDLLELKDGETFCDLGCGTGNVLTAARRRTDVRAVGLELNPAVALVAALRAAKDRKVRVLVRDARKASLSSYDALYAFLMPRAMAELAAPLEIQLPTGARVVSVDFEIPGWRASVRRECKGGHDVHLYVIGRHKSTQVV